MASIEKRGGMYVVRWLIYQNGKRGDRQRTFDHLRDANKFKAEIETRQCRRPPVRV